MHRNRLTVLAILLAATAARAQYIPGDNFHRGADPVHLPPPPSAVPQPAALPTVSVPPPLQTGHPAATAEPNLPQPESLTLFDPQRTELKRTMAGWQMVVDGMVLKDFGPQENDARAALHLVRDLGLNQHGTVGGAAPVMEYWLRDGKAPHGLTTGLQVYSLDPATLRVSPANDRWSLRDAQRPLFDFGTSATDAQQALAVIRKYGFTEIGVLGQEGPVMLVFLGRRPTTTVATAAPQPAQPAGVHDTAVKPAAFDHSSPFTAVKTPFPPQATGPTLGPEIVNSSANDVEVRTALDCSGIEAAQDGKLWKLKAKQTNQEYATFLSEREARLAQSAVVYYHFTELVQVGTPKAHFSYFLANNQVPKGPMLGIPAEVFQPEKLKIVQVNNSWTISTGDRTLLSFEDKLDEARHVLDLIQHNKCDRLCRIGMAMDGMGMTFLVRSR